MSSVQDRARLAGKQALGRVKAMAPATRIAAVVAVVVLGAGGYFVLNWASTPTYAPLFTNLAPADASAVVDKLNAGGIAYQLGANGTEVLVPKHDVYTQRIALSAAGIPSSPQTGYSLLDNLGVTASEFQQHVDYQRALEGELGKTIQSIDGVNAASVHLAIPQQDVFNDGTQKTTAAVLLTLNRGVALNAQQVTGVVNLVASSVPGLTTDSVTVTDSTGHVLSSGGTVAGDAAGDDAAVGYEQRVSSQLQRMLDTLVGPGKAVVTVNADVDLSKTTTKAHTYTAEPSVPPLAQANSTETYNGSGAAAAGGVAGATASPTAAPVSGPDGGSYSKTTNTQNNAVGTIDTTTETAPGSVTKLGIAVVLDDRVPQSITQAAITSLVNSAAGVDPKRGDSVTVQRLAFDRSAQQQADAAQKAQDAAAAAAANRTMLFELIGAGAAIAVVLLLGVLFALRRRRHRPEEPDELDLMPVQLPDPEPAPRPKPWHELNLEASRKQLHDLAAENPADVAKVLRTWLTN